MADLTYILPIKRSTPADDELAAYLRWIAERAEVIVVDGSPFDVFVAHERAWQGVRHVPPRPELEAPNGKVWGVLTGLELASNDIVLIADDDVRYDDASLRAVRDLLNHCDLVRPQNYFDPLPWHAAWDTARTLINRALDGDWPGTIAVRKRFLPHGYDGAALFENLELSRTVRANGGREIVAREIYVRRLPPTTQHFFAQRVRQAYDEFARPWRLAAQLALLPFALVLAAHRPKWLIAFAALSVAVAETGRRRDGGTRYFPWLTSLFAPLWLAERGVCAWLAVLSQLRNGGVLYHGRMLRTAAHSEDELRSVKRAA